MPNVQREMPVINGEFLDALEAIDLYIKSVSGGQFGGARRSHAYGSSMEFADYREYVPGDDLRRIDWNLVGRFDKYYMKQFVDERQLESHVYLDMSASMDWGDAGRKGMAALRLAAAMGFLSVQNLDRVAYYLLTKSKCVDLCGIIMGRESFYRAAEKLSKLSFGGNADLKATILSNPNPGFDNGMSFIISDFLTDSNWKSAVDYLLSRRRGVAVIQVLSPDEIDPICNGQLYFLDAEAQQEDDNCSMHMEVDRSAMKAYKQAVQFFQNDMKRFCASRDIVFLTVRSDEKIEDIILEKGFMAGLIK